MNRIVLYVSPNKATGRWIVHWQGDSSGKAFSLKTDAITYARRLVGSLPEGTCSQIKVQRLDGTYQTEWTYGRDPFPPEG